jgi:hypothetical protein
MFWLHKLVGYGKIDGDRGSGSCPVVRPVFKTGGGLRRAGHGGFDPHPLPPSSPERRTGGVFLSFAGSAPDPQPQWMCTIIRTVIEKCPDYGV